MFNSKIYAILALALTSPALPRLRPGTPPLLQSATAAATSR